MSAAVKDTNDLSEDQSTKPQLAQPPAIRSISNVPAHLQDDIDEFAGAGSSDRREDNVVPFLYIAQKGSPQVNKRDPAYIEGLEPGMVFDTTTGKMWQADEGKGPLLLQAHFESAEVEWGLRTAGGGYFGRHPSNTPLLSQVREVTREGGRGVTRLLPNGHQLVSTNYHYMILADEVRPIALALSSTGLQPSKLLNTKFQNTKLKGRDGKLVVAPSFATLIRLDTRWKQNDAGDWFVAHFETLGWVSFPEYEDAYNEAKKLSISARKGMVKTAEPPADEFQTGAHSTYDPDVNPGDDSPL